MAELQQRQENQRQLERQQYEAHLDELQQQEELQWQLEIQQNQADLAELQQQHDDQWQMEEDQHQINLDQQLQIHLQEEADHVQQVINNNNVLRNTQKVVVLIRNLNLGNFWVLWMLNVSSVMLCISNAKSLQILPMVLRSLVYAVSKVK